VETKRVATASFHRPLALWLSSVSDRLLQWWWWWKRVRCGTTRWLSGAYSGW